MQTYWQNTTAPGNIDRGLYIILPLRYQGSFQSILVDKEDPELPELTFDTSDFTELLSVKCRNGNFVKRFSVNSKLQEIVEAWNGKAETSKKYQIDDLQLFIFNNGIAFISRKSDMYTIYLTESGYKKYKYSIFHMRPIPAESVKRLPVPKQIHNKEYLYIAHFYCSDFQIFNYFFSFGDEVYIDNKATQEKFKKVAYAIYMSYPDN